MTSACAPTAPTPSATAWCPTRPRRKPLLAPAFYDSYYKVLSDYLEEINYGGTQAPRSPLACRPVSANRRARPRPSSAATAALRPPTRSRRDRLAELKELLDEGLITQDEFDARRREILAEV